MIFFCCVLAAAKPTCGAEPLLEIPKCRLNGLTINQLQFLDPSCDINDFIIDETVTNYVLSINPNLCNAFVVSTNRNKDILQRSQKSFRRISNLNLEFRFCLLIFNYNVGFIRRPS